MPWRSWLGTWPESFSAWQRLSYIVLLSPLGSAWDQVQVVLSLIACWSYVVSTCDECPQPPDGLDYALASLFGVDYLLRWAAAPSTWRYPMTPWAIVDALAIAPTVVMRLEGGAHTGLVAVRILRVLRALRVLKVFRCAWGYDGVGARYWGAGARAGLLLFSPWVERLFPSGVVRAPARNQFSPPVHRSCCVG